MEIKKKLWYSLMCNIIFSFINIIFIMITSKNEKIVGFLGCVSISLYAFWCYKWGESRKNLYTSYICLIINSLAMGALIIKSYPSSLYMCITLLVLFLAFLIYTLFHLK
jgi:hypothetical protein